MQNPGPSIYVEDITHLVHATSQQVIDLDMSLNFCWKFIYNISKNTKPKPKIAMSVRHDKINDVVIFCVINSRKSLVIVFLCFRT